MGGAPGSESAPDDGAALAAMEEAPPPKGTPAGTPTSTGRGGAGSGGKPVAGDAAPMGKPIAAAPPTPTRGPPTAGVPKDGIAAGPPRAMRRRRAISAWLLASCTSREWICCCCCISTAWVANWVSSPPVGAGVVVAGTPPSGAIEVTAVAGVVAPIPASVAGVPPPPPAAPTASAPATGGGGGDAATAAAAASATAPALLGALSLKAGRAMGGSGNAAARAAVSADINGLGSSAGTADGTASGAPLGGMGGDMAAVLRNSTTAHKESAADAVVAATGRWARSPPARAAATPADAHAMGPPSRPHNREYTVIGTGLQGQ